MLIGPLPSWAATDYYVSPLGNDANAGTSPAAAWQSLNRLNLIAFSPGDRILLEGGARFTGQLVFDAVDHGTATQPIVLSTYGTGRATIDAGTGTAIQLYNTAGFRITNLSLVGAGRSINTGSGLSAFTDLGGGVKLQYLYIEQVNASGFGESGIEIVGTDLSGFEDVTIKFSAAWDNGQQGIMTYGTAVGAHRNVYVGYSKAFNNAGINTSDSTGNGIVLGGVDTGMIERSVASNNGARAIGPHGPIGIWTYYANDVTIQFNESYNNRTAGWADGGGFALDVGVTNSTIQYNYSHNNHGTGFLLAGGFDPANHANNVIRYNISENDGRRNGFGAVQIWGRTRNTHIYNNTVFTSADAATQSKAVYITNAYATGHYPVGVSFRNNIFYTTGGIATVHVLQSVLPGASIRFENNNYFAASGSPRIVWGGTTYSSVTTWANATTQEKNAIGLLGMSVDPMLGSPGGGATLDDASRLTTLSAYLLRTGSPMVDSAVNLAPFGLAADQDYYGTIVPQQSGFDIGAHEWTPNNTWASVSEIVLYADDATALSGSWSLMADTTAAGRVKLTTTDVGFSNTTAPLSAPTHHVDVAFSAQAHTRYRIWLRLRARADSKVNDSLFVQFSDAVNGSGAPIYRIGTTSALTVNLATCSTCAVQGWGWQNRAYWLADTGDVWFPTTGTRTLRIQVREDGVELDQIVLSPSKYLSQPPGPVTNDSTIVPKPDDSPPPPPNTAPSVVITAPADGTQYTAPATITVTANASDSDGSIARVEFYAGTTLIGSKTTAPYTISWSQVPAGQHTVTADATDNAGAVTTSAPVRVSITSPPPTSVPEIVIYAADVTTLSNWTLVRDTTAAGGMKLTTLDEGWSNTTAPLAAPTKYVDATFTAPANMRYRLWLRLRARADSKWNDSVFVQFSDTLNSARAPIHRIGTTQGLVVNLATCSTCAPQAWGWQNRGYWLGDTGDVWFATSGSHTIRVQLREDGVELDQIVLSPSRYLTSPPGPVVNDTTIVPKP